MPARYSALILSALCAIANPLPAAHADEQSAYRFDLPEQPLAEALRAIARQTGTNVLFQSKDMLGIRSPVLRAEVTTDEAIRHVLSGTSLRAERTTPTTVIVQPVSPGAAADSSEELELILVTGSRLKRVDAEGPSPVHVISRQDIDRSGAATVREVLSTVTQNATARDESGNASFLGASTVQLRGLPLGTTLMLLNGRRLGASGPQVSYNIFDISNVPLEAVERIEVLTDSASAIYGADAIGGAVNIILREDFEGAGMGARYGTSSEGDADERQASFTVGRSGQAASGLLVFDYYDRDLLRSSQRDLTSTADFTRFGGDDLRSTWSYPGNVYSLDGSALPGLSNSFAGIPSGTDGTGLTAADFQATDGVLNRFDGANYGTLSAASERTSVFASGRYRFSSGLSLFAEALFTHRNQRVLFPPEPLPYGEFGFFTVPADNPFNPFGVAVGLDYRFLEMGPRTNDLTTDFSRFVVGASGAWGRFDWEFYWLGDRDQSEIVNGRTLNSTLNAEVIQEYLNSTDPNVALNVFSTTGNNNPQTLAAILNATATTDDLSSRASMTEAIVRGPLWTLPAGTLNAVFGLNVRRERVDFLSPLAGDLRDQRNSKSVFAELAIPLVSPAQGVPVVSSLELTAAVRHDDYEDFDSSTKPQFGLTWRPWRSLLVRASYGEAYKAPTPFQLFYPPITFPSATFDPARNGEPSEFVQIVGGNPQLKPERGTSTTFGVIWEPTFARGWTLSMNAFRVRQEDFITAFDADLVLANEALFPERVVRAPVLPTDPPGFSGRIISIDATNINFGTLTTKGFDGELQYAFAPSRAGNFVASLYVTYIDEFEILIAPGSPAVNVVNQANAAGYPLRFKSNAGLAWNRAGGWSAALTARHMGSYTDYDGIHELPAQTLFDVQLGRSFGEHGDLWLVENVDVTLGVINLTNEQGHFSRSFAGYDYQQADMRGRFYYLNLKARF
jgi:iron complex outermembrane receptor protein